MTAARRRAGRLGLPIAILAAGLLAGCHGASALTGGVGVTKDAEGKLAFVVYWCDRPPSELTVYHVEESRTDDPNPEDTRYTVSGLKPKNWTTVSAADPAPPWTLESGSTALDASVTYTAQAGKIHQRTDAYSVDFRVTDVQHLSTGQVIYQLAGPAKVAASPAEFVRLISATC